MFALCGLRLLFLVHHLLQIGGLHAKERGQRRVCGHPLEGDGALRAGVDALIRQSRGFNNGTEMAPLSRRTWRVDH